MKTEIFVFSAVFLVIQVNAQLFGGVNTFPGGGRSETIGLRAGPAWGSLSQNRDFRGFTGPKTVSGGLNLLTPAGSGLSGSFAHQLGTGGQAAIRGQANLLNTPNHNLNAWAEHSRLLDKNFKIVGPETNSAGLNYEHKTGLNAFGSVSQTHGFKPIGTVGVGAPIYKSNDGLTSLNVQGQSSFASGMKPNHQVGLQFEKKF